MDDEESKQLSDIQSEVTGTHAQLGVINERTKNIEKQLTSLSDEVESNKQDINELQDKVKRNSTVITGFGTVVSGVAIWFADKLSRIM